MSSTDQDRVPLSKSTGTPSYEVVHLHKEMQFLLDPKNLKCIYEALKQQVDHPIWQHKTMLAESLLYVLLYPKSTLNAKVTAVRFLKHLFDCGSNSVAIDSLPVFQKFYCHASNVIFDKETCGPKNISEELKTEIMVLLRILMEKAPMKTLLAVYSKDHLNFLSQGLLLACKIAEQEKCTALRCKALEFILAFLQFHGPQELKEKVQVALLRFVPGVVLALAKIIQFGTENNQVVVQIAFRAFGWLLYLALEDIRDEVKTKSDEQYVESWRNPPPKPQPIDQVCLNSSVRTKEWTRAAGVKFTPFLYSPFKTWPSLHPKVRFEIVYANHRLLTTCANSLGDGVLVLLDGLIFLTLDSDSDVKGRAKKAIDYLVETNEEGLTRWVEERLPSVLAQLLQMFCSGNEDVGTYILLLEGYFNYLHAQDELQSFLTLPHNSRKVAKVLSIMATFQLCPDLLNRTVLENGSTHKTVVKRTEDSLKLKYIERNDLQRLKNICRMLEASILSVIECLTQHDCPENLAVLGMLVEHAIIISIPNLEMLCDYFLTTLERQRMEDGKTPKEMQAIVLNTMLSLEGLGLVAKRIPYGRELDKFLLKSLYSIVERMESEYTFIENAAGCAAGMIAEACKCKSVDDLMGKYADLLVHKISLNLRRRSPEVLKAAAVVIKLCPKEAVSALKSVVDCVLKSSNVTSQRVVPYLGVFLMIVRCSAQAVHKGADSDGKAAFQKLKQSTIDKLLVHVSKRQKEALESSEGEDEQTKNEETEKIKPPPNVELCASVLQRALFCVSSPNTEVALASVRVLEEGIHVLKGWDDLLLPLVHQIWGPLVTKLNPRVDLLTLYHCFRLLTALASLAKDFIRFRTLKEVLPGIKDAIIEVSKSSRNVAKNSAYNTTQKFKLQKTILDGLGSLTCDLNLRERETDWVIECAIPYLSARQHPVLQEKAVELLRNLMTHDPHLVDYRIKELSSVKEMKENVYKLFPPEEY